MICNMLRITSFYLMLVTASEKPSASVSRPKHEQVVEIASLIDRNAKSVMAKYIDCDPPSSAEVFETMWLERLEASKDVLLKDLDKSLLTDKKIYELAFNIVLINSSRYNDVFVNIQKHFDKCDEDIWEVLEQRFYDEVIDKINKDYSEKDTSYFAYVLDMAVERHIFSNFLVFFVGKCHVDNSLVGLFTEYPDLVDRNIEKYKHNKNVAFVFKSIVNNFVYDKGVFTDEKIVILQGFIEQLYNECVCLHLEHDVLIGFNKDFVSGYEEIINSLQTNDVKELTIESLIENKTFTKLFPSKFFDQIPANLKQYTDLKLFVKELSKMRIEKYFEEFRGYAKKWLRRHKYKGDANKYRVNIKDEPLLMFKLQDTRKDFVLSLIEDNQKWKDILHLEFWKKRLDYNLDNIRQFIGMEFKSSVSELCPISESVMTRPVGFERIEMHYDLTSIMLYWIHSVLERKVFTYQIYMLSSDKTVDIRNYLINEARSQSILTFFKRIGSFRELIEDFQFHKSLGAEQANFKEIISNIIRKFPSISKEHRDWIMIKVNEFDRLNSDQNDDADDGNDEEVDIEEYVSIHLDLAQQNQNPECDAIKYKESKIVCVRESSLSDSEKNAEAWNKIVSKVRKDLQDYRSRLS